MLVKQVGIRVFMLFFVTIPARRYKNTFNIWEKRAPYGGVFRPRQLYGRQKQFLFIVCFKSLPQNRFAFFQFYLPSPR